MKQEYNESKVDRVCKILLNQIFSLQKNWISKMKSKWLCRVTPTLSFLNGLQPYIPSLCKASPSYNEGLPCLCDI